jgi:hypothetical protein
LKTFFIGLGGDLSVLQQNSPIERLPLKKDGLVLKPKTKLKKFIPLTVAKIKNKKTKKINKDLWRKTSSKLLPVANKKISRSKLI